jgi:poly-gamma-glutamate capsule biosynthesis protein CapA/YwtB (metallophosphatase superfamily)
MVQSYSLHNRSSVQLARRGHPRAIADWLNQTLLPYGIFAYPGRPKKPGQLRLLLEFQFSEYQQPQGSWHEALIRFICHQIWQLNSPAIEGLRISARFFDQPKTILWRQSIRIITPALRQRKHKQQIKSQIHQTTQHKNRLRRARIILVGGPAAAAVVVGGVLGYSRAPKEQTEAAAVTTSLQNQLPTRPDTVRTALETVPVVKHNQVTNAKDPTVTLMFAGDVTFADNFKDVIGKDYKKPFAKLDEYRQADLSMVNLENPLTRANNPMPDKQFNFKADPEDVKVLEAGGVDIVNLANNHTMDYQADGLKETLKTLDKSGIQYVGAGKDITEARRPKIIDVKGQRVAYLSYWGDEYGAEANKPGVNSIQETRIAEDIKAIRNQVDWVIVNYHWGQELAEAPADWQVKLGRFTVDQGADVVVGHHPHVLQGAEIYRGRPIAYSLGNFIFGGNSRTDYDTAVMKVALKDKQMKVEFLPVEVKGYQPQIAQGDQANQILQKMTQLSANFTQPMNNSVVLDARTLPPPPPAAVVPPANPAAGSTMPATATPATTTPSVNTPTIDSLAPGAPSLSPSPLPTDLEPTLPSLPSQGAFQSPAPLPTTPATTPDTPASSTSPSSTDITDPNYYPSPVEPGGVDILPGYGEVQPPSSASPDTTTRNQDAGADVKHTALPTAGATTNAPAQSLPADPAVKTVAKAEANQPQQNQTETASSHEDTVTDNVALAGPMMW